MDKNYSKGNNTTTTMLPKEETIDFILNYSKALKIVKVGNEKIEIIAN